jgi:hypothetical protein
MIGVIRETKYENLIWINPIFFVPKPSEKVRLIIHTRKVNKLKTRWGRKHLRRMFSLIKNES